MTTKEILNSSFVEVVKESLLNDSYFYAQMSLKFGDDEEKEQEQLDLSNKYYDTLTWFEDFIKKHED
jgi:hypothetical protein